MKLIPIFLDYTGTIDSLTKDKKIAEKFNDLLCQLEKKTGGVAQVYIISGNNEEVTQKRNDKIFEIFGNGYIKTLYGEYGGIKTNNGKVVVEGKNQLTDKQFKTLKAFIGKNSNNHKRIEINPTYQTITNIQFENFTEEEFYNVTDKLQRVFKNKSVVPYYDKYGIECEIKAKSQTKANCAKSVLKTLPDVLFVIYGGDNYDEDFNMFLADKTHSKKFIAPKNITKLSLQKDVITTSKEEIYGICEGLEEIVHSL